MRAPLRVIGIVAILALPLVAVGAADIVVIPVAEARLEHLARSALSSASAQASMEGFPVLGRALATSGVARMDFAWFGVELGEVQATSLEMHLEGVALDRSAWLRGDLRISGVESGDMRMVISAGEVSRLIDRETRIEAGTLFITVTPAVEVVGRISASQDGLVVVGAGLEPVTSDLGTDLLPCAPSTQIERNGVVLECSFRGLPNLLRS